MWPKGSTSDGHKPLQRLTGGGMFFGESCGDGLTENLHFFNVPIFGNIC